MNIKSIIKSTTKALFSIIPKSKHKIVFESYSDFCDNSKALYDYLLTNGYGDNYKFIWCVKNPNGYQNQTFPNTILTSFRQKKYMLSCLYHIATSKYIFYTHAKPPMINTNKQTVVCLWHGIPLKRIELYGNNPKESFNYLTSTGEFYDEVMKDCFHAEETQFVTTGFPRNDLLFETNNSLKKLSINKSDYKKVIIWMPTFRQHKDTHYSEATPTGTGLPLFDNEEMLTEFNEILKQNKMLLIIKLHPAQDLSFIKVENLSNMILLTNHELDKNEVKLYNLVGESDALLTDYSSIYFDYLLLNRPIGFIIEDIKEYTQNRGFTVEDPFALMPGEKLYDKQKLYSFIEDLSNDIDKYKEQRNTVCNLVHTYKDGNSSKRVSEMFLK